MSGVISNGDGSAGERAFVAALAPGTVSGGAGTGAECTPAGMSPGYRFRISMNSSPVMVSFS